MPIDDRFEDPEDEDFVFDGDPDELASAFDGDADDTVSAFDSDEFDPPPHVDDRLWRHPAEVAAAARAALEQQELSLDTLAPDGAESPPSSESHRSRSPFALTGAIAVVGLLVVGGLQFRSEPEPSTVAVQAGVTAAEGDDAAEPLRLRVRAGLPRIEVIVNGQTSTGSGILIDDIGHIMTSAQLVRGASHIIVWEDHARYEAIIVGTDELTDVAVLATQSRTTPADLGTDQVIEGQYALIVSNEKDDLTMGQVVRVADEAEVDGVKMYGLFKTTLPPADTEPGAAIFDNDGVIIGMTPGGDTMSGHAIPITLAARIAEQILTDGEASHAWLGIQGVDADQGGAEVVDVRAGGPAAIAGIRTHDVITAIADSPVGSMSDLVVALQDLSPEQTVSVDFTRRDRDRVATLELGKVND